MNPESPDKRAQQNFDPQSASLVNADPGDSTVSLPNNGPYENYSWAKSTDEYHAAQALTDPGEGTAQGAENAHDVFLGTTINDRYQILSRLGSGGMSVVYKARHTLLHQNLAVKFLLPENDLDSKTLNRFQQEAKAAYSLNHPNIARVSELGVEGAHPYIVMDFVEGPTLGEIIEKDGPMPVDRTLRLISQACAGLEHAHAKDVIHRDIKPGNLIISKEGGPKNANQGETLKIVDFGIAKIMHAAEGTQHLTQTGEVFGSPLYMSPEQAMGKTLDSRCDVYALGCVMYEALSGKPPFRGANILDTLTKHINDEPEPLKDTPAALRVIVKRAMEKLPKDRYQTMKEFRNDLEAVLEGNQSKLTSTIKLLIKPKVRRWLIPTGIVAVALLGGIIWTFPEIAASPRFDHRTDTSWMWVPEPKSAESTSETPAATEQPAENNESGERSFGDVKNDNQKDRTQLALRVGDGDRAYEKENPKPDDLKSAIASYSWASDNWDACNTNSNYTGSTDWDRAMCESRLADCYRLTGDLEKAVAHYKIAKPLWSGLGEPAKSNDAMCGLNIAYIESQLKSALSMSPAATWDNLSKAFSDNKYLGVVRQDWSNVQWNMGSPIEAELSRVRAVMDRNSAGKKPYTGLPLAKS